MVVVLVRIVQLVARSGIMNSLESMTNPSNYVQTIVNSRGVKSLGNYHFQMGYNADGTPKESATTIDMVSTSGNIRTKGTVQSGQNFGDYAEYFESQSDNLSLLVQLLP